MAWHAVKISPFKKGDSVLVLGGGPIGLAVVQTLKAKGAEKIIVSEMASRRREFAKQFGADYVLDPTKDDIVAKVREICDGKGANVAFDCAGVQAGLDQAILSIRARGTLVNIAVWEKSATIVPNRFAFRERSYIGIATYVEGDFQEVIGAIASGESARPSTPMLKLTLRVGSLKPETMITKKIKMEEVEEEGYKTLINDKDNQVKVLIEISP